MTKLSYTKKLIIGLFTGAVCITAVWAATLPANIYEVHPDTGFSVHLILDQVEDNGTTLTGSYKADPTTPPLSIDICEKYPTKCIRVIYYLRPGEPGVRTHED